MGTTTMEEEEANSHQAGLSSAVPATAPLPAEEEENKGGLSPDIDKVQLFSVGKGVYDDSPPPHTGQNRHMKSEEEEEKEEDDSLEEEQKQRLAVHKQDNNQPSNEDDDKAITHEEVTAFNVVIDEERNKNTTSLPGEADPSLPPREEHHAAAAVAAAAEKDTTAAMDGAAPRSDNDDEDATTTTTTATSFSLNDKYGHRMGIWQSVSLVLNAGLMVYAHVGLSAVMLSSIQRLEDQNNDAVVMTDENANNATTPTSSGGGGSNLTTSNNTTNQDDNAAAAVFVMTGACNERDYMRWTEGNGLINQATEADFCALTRLCLVNAQCNTDCFVNEHGYTSPCAACFGAMPSCSAAEGCAGVCYADPYSEECIECSRPCTDIFFECTGLPRTLPTPAPTPAPTDPVSMNNTTTYPVATATPSSVAATTTPTVTTSSAVEEETSAEICKRQQAGLDYEDVEQYYRAYEIQFFPAIETAWTNDARLLAIIVMLFSGVWPYTKNVILMLAWYLRLSEAQRSWILKWLRRLGKYTLVDVYIVILLLVGVIIQVNLADGRLPLFIRGEPRPAIVAFLLATLWEFVHIEWMTHCHVKVQHHEALNPLPGALLQAMRFRTGLSVIKKEDEPTTRCKHFVFLRACMCFLLAIAVVLFVVGSSMEVVRFTTILGGETYGCVRSYNLYELGTVWVSDYFLYDNSAKAGTWTLYMAYVLFVLAIPMFVHLVHFLVFVANVKNQMLCRVADMLWTFASVEVLMLGVFTVQYKFDDMVADLAGDDGAGFFSVTSELGPGFFILIVYSFFGGCVHYFFNSAVTEYYQCDPHFQIDAVWTNLCGCVMVENDKKAEIQCSRRHHSSEPRSKTLIQC